MKLLQRLFQFLPTKHSIMNLFDNKTMEGFIKRFPDFVETSIRSALGRHIVLATCEDIEDLVQDVYTMLLSCNIDKNISQEQVLLDIREFSPKVAYDYLRKHSKKEEKEYVA